MQLGDAAQPHAGLLATRSPTKLRPLGRRPVILQQYCCRVCDTNWLLEQDPLEPEHAEWICLYQAANILDPVSVVHQRTRSSVPAVNAGQSRTSGDAQADALSHRFA
ncbi:hypothetical protein J8I87_02375 [Paraburkholderia sp. LEh10]|uniref:hypothetical protein n=1 Tax=Paraburkholderia sp. LEh10 TaxID=2821353 RepID=UPI001AE47B28|nr:hypothetical protein [Paraburkholderia sp. LEh10]MBP0588581.1 hypothetical protein [Paraburkholderia sp. LEh10]